MFYFQKMPNEQDRPVSPEDVEAETVVEGRLGTEEASNATLDAAILKMITKNDYIEKRAQSAKLYNSRKVKYDPSNLEAPEGPLTFFKILNNDERQDIYQNIDEFKKI